MHDSDSAVHELYRRPAAVPVIDAAFPGTIVDGVVDRASWRAAVLGKPEAMKRLEAIVHPLVGARIVMPFHGPCPRPACARCRGSRHYRCC